MRNFSQNVIKHKTRLSRIVIVLICLLLAGCSNSIPECDSFAVHSVLNDILQDNGIVMDSNNAIATIHVEDNIRMCSSIVQTKNEQIPIDYEIIVADDGDEFMVTIR